MNDRIQEIRERQERATPGPWQAEGREIWRRGESYTANIGGHVWVADVEHVGTREFIVRAPSDIAYLLSEVERLQGLMELAKDTVESLYQLTQRGELSSFDIMKADGVYDTFLSHLKG